MLQALAVSAVDSTGATAGWLAVADGDSLRVVAAGGGVAPDSVGARASSDEGIEGYVLTSGQPMALSGAAGDERLSGGIVGALKMRPQSVLCVPCGDRESVLGVLVLLDKQGGVSFSFDDVEIATLLAGIAGVALAASGRPAAAPSPQELSAGLERLAAADPAQYAAVAALVSAIVTRG